MAPPPYPGFANKKRLPVPGCAGTGRHERGNSFMVVAKGRQHLKAKLCLATQLSWRAIASWFSSSQHRSNAARTRPRKGARSSVRVMPARCHDGRAIFSVGFYLVQLRGAAMVRNARCGLVRLIRPLRDQSQIAAFLVTNVLVDSRGAYH